MALKVYCSHFHPHVQRAIYYIFFHRCSWTNCSFTCVSFQCLLYAKITSNLYSTGQYNLVIPKKKFFSCFNTLSKGVNC